MLISQQAADAYEILERKTDSTDAQTLKATLMIGVTDSLLIKGGRRGTGRSICTYRLPFQVGWLRNC